MSASSNLQSEIAPLLRKLGMAMNFSRSSGGKAIGEAVADVIAAGVYTRTLEQHRSPAGGPLTSNAGEYGKAKRSRGVPVGVGLYGDEVGGDMLELENVRGMVTIGDDVMQMEYGLDDEAKQKGEWFTDGNPSNNQVARPFYELDNEIEDRVMEVMEQSAIDAIQEIEA